MNNKEDFGLDEYERTQHDIDEDEIEDDEEIDYENFNKASDFDVDEDYLEEEYSLDNKNSSSTYDRETIIKYLTWFGRVGIVIALALSAYFISRGRIKDLLLYILLLVTSYFVGYYTMYLIDKRKNQS